MWYDAAAAGGRRERLLVGQHLGHRHRGADDGGGAARVHAGDAAAPAVEVAHQVAGEVRRRVHLDVHDRLEQRRPRARHGVAEREPARQLERHFARVDVVVRPVGHRHAEVDDRIAGQIAAQRACPGCPFRRPGTNCRGIEPPKMSSTNSKSDAARQRLHRDLAVAELAVAAGLLLVAAVRLDLAR